MVLTDCGAVQWQELELWGDWCAWLLPVVVRWQHSADSEQVERCMPMKHVTVSAASLAVDHGNATLPLKAVSHNERSAHTGLPH